MSLKMHCNNCDKELFEVREATEAIPSGSGTRIVLYRPTSAVASAATRFPDNRLDFCDSQCVCEFFEPSSGVPA